MKLIIYYLTAREAHQIHKGHKGQQTTSAHIQAHQHPWQSP